MSSSTSCGVNNDKDVVVFAMDTVITIRAEKLSNKAAKDAEELIYRLESVFSQYTENSELFILNKSGFSDSISSELYEVIKKSLFIADTVNGAFDPTLGKLTTLWSIPSSGIVPKPDEIESALSECGLSKVSLTEDSITLNGITLDLGGAAKGFALQETVEFLKESGSPFGIVSFGGNVGVYGSKYDGNSWTIAIRDPYDTSSVIGRISITDGYVSVSGDYERYFESEGKRYHHILDSTTGYPADSGVHSAAVWCRDGTLGDILSTALFVMGDKGMNELYEVGLYEFEALLVTDNGIVMTDGMRSMYTPYDI